MNALTPDDLTVLVSDVHLEGIEREYRRFLAGEARVTEAAGALAASRPPHDLVRRTAEEQVALFAVQRRRWGELLVAVTLLRAAQVDWLDWHGGPIPLVGIADLEDGGGGEPGVRRSLWLAQMAARHWIETWGTGA